MPRLRASSASSRGVQWLIGRPDASGGSLARAMIWHHCSGAEGGRSPGAWGVLETLGHGTAGACEPMATPASDRGTCGAEATGHVGCCQALRQ